MKFLLVAVNSKYIHTNPALYSLKAYVSHYRPDIADCVDIKEYTVNHRLDEVLGDIYKQKPDALGFSVYIWNVSFVLSFVRELHKVMPDIPIWLGGPEVSYRAEEILKSYSELTGIMIGEGERTFSEILSCYLGEGLKNLDNINGICYRKQETVSDSAAIIFTEERELTNLSELPFLYGDFQDFERFRHKIIYYESSRGCPFCCSYCLSSIDKKLRLRDIDTVKKELRFFLDQKVPQVKFIDRTFNCDHAHAQAVWNYIKEHDNGITNFHFEIAADLLNENELELLKSMRPGAVQMEIGVQTTNTKTLREIRRVTDMKKLKEAVACLRAGKNIHIHLDLIAGLPYEDYEGFQHSFNDVYRMKPEQLQLGFLKVLSGSYMKEKAQDYRLFYTDIPPYEVLCTRWMTFEEIRRLKQIEEVLELYYNSNQFPYTLPYLERFFESPFALYEALADFYEKKGCFINTPSRAYRYHVLLEFAKELKEADILLLKELLTMDVYLREHAKSRPDFAKDITPYKERIRRFYREEEKNRENGTHILKNYTDCEPRRMARMLHAEIFSYDIFGENPTYRKIANEILVLYDYRERNPLTYDARIVIPDEKGKDK